MEKYTSSRVISIAVTALLVGCLFWLMATKRVNSSLEAGLEEQKLKSESLLSEKLLLEKDIQKIKSQLSRLTGENAELDELVRSTTARLHSQESEYNRMKRENLNLNNIKKQRQELTELNRDLQNRLLDLTSSNTNLETQNAELQDRLAFLEQQNEALARDLNNAVFAAVDQSQVQAVKGKREKLTIKAKQTKKLMANFDVASNLTNLSFRVLDANGNPLSQNRGTVAFTTSPSENNFIASAEPRSAGNNLQRVEMVFIPNQRLDAGVYTVEVLNDNLYVGALRVKLK